MNDLQREISRFLFPRLNCLRFLTEEIYRTEIIDLIDRGVGGFVLFEGNVNECARAVAVVREHQAERPLLLAADCEHGLTMRFDGGTEFPSAWALGSAEDADLTYRVGYAIACEMRTIGLDWNFAPVLDVNTNPENPVINTRAFGEDPEAVAAHGTAYAAGLRDGGIIACGKHFPGHGDTAVDSHISLPVLPFDVSRLHAVEFVPFRRAIDEGIPALMSAHLAVPALDPSGNPASLSKPVLSGFLRGTLGFDGLLVTDALDMGAIVETYGTGEAAVRAFLAGNDVLEIPADPVEALEELRRATVDGRIGAERIGESSRRLDAVLAWRRSRPELRLSRDWKGDHESLALEAARAALKTSPRGSTIPPGSSILSIIIRDETAARAAGLWREMLEATYEATIVEIESGAWSLETDETLRKERMSGRRLVLSLMIRPRGGAGTVGLGAAAGPLIDAFARHSGALVNFGNPYLLRDLHSDVRIDAFSYATPSLSAAIDALSGGSM